MIDSLFYTKLPQKLKRSVSIVRGENLDESDDLRMATLICSTSRPKSFLSSGYLTDIDCNCCKEKGHIVEDREKLKKKKEKDAQKGKPTQKNIILSVGLVKRQTTLNNDVSRVRVRISSPNLLGLETHRIATMNPKHRKLAITPHCPTPSPNQSRTIQKTNFATTPTQPPQQQIVRSDPPTKFVNEYQQ